MRSVLLASGVGEDMMATLSDGLTIFVRAFARASGVCGAVDMDCIHR